MKSVFYKLLIVCLVAGPSVARADAFDKIKSTLAEAACVRVEFLSILESKIFKQVDTSKGTADLLRDGRYVVTVGDDEYLYDREHTYTYSRENNQVVIEGVDSSAAYTKEVSYLMHMDDLFITRVVRPDLEYRLIKRSQRMPNLPDTITVMIDKEKLRLVSLSYHDINDEPTRIEFLRLTSSDKCDERRFEPNFPDSVQRVKL